MVLPQMSRWLAAGGKEMACCGVNERGHGPALRRVLLPGLAVIGQASRAWAQWPVDPAVAGDQRDRHQRE